MGRRFVIWLHPSFYNVLSLNITPLKSFLISIDLHNRHRIKIYFIKKEHVRAVNSKKLKI